LKTNFRKEITKFEISKTLGNGTDDIYELTPWKFDKTSFLLKKEILTKNIPFTQAEGKRYVKYKQNTIP
jgi:hypothetical protein